MPTKLSSIPFAQPTRHHSNVPGQLPKYIPRWIVQAAARESGVDGRARTFPVWSHPAAMVFVHLAHAFSLNDVCRLAAAQAPDGRRIRSHTASALFHANKGRSADFVEAVSRRTPARTNTASRPLAVRD